MNFQDIVDSNKEQIELVNNLKEIRSYIGNALVRCNEINNNLFVACCSAATNQINAACSNLRNQYTMLRETLIAIDGYELKDTINKIKALYNNEIIDLLLNTIEFDYKEIIRIRRIFNNDADKSNNYSQCFKILSDMIVKIDTLETLFSYTSIINKDLCKGIKDAPLRIRSNTENITQESFKSIIHPIQIMYTQLCMILNVDEKVEPIEIVRVESGTWNFNINLNSDIGKIILGILSKFHEFFVRNFTRQGRKINIAESLDITSTELNIIKIMEEVGIDTSSLKPIAKETAAIIFKQANVFLSANPDVKVNEKVLSRSEDTKKLLNTPMYIEESSVKKQEDKSNDN
ncbi:hypothetical protein [Clostridium hydrogenum]|uniref:hypothetical protein n=1 Tax=Clostridium hydrogenum TaxID=2855764 RepID=UPI001F400C06|nr:hypothetical protein [Clostridium hydrogenum]